MTQTVICEPLTAPGVQVSQSRAVAGHVAYAHICNASAVGHAQVAQTAFQTGDLTQAEVPYQAAVTEAELPYWRAVEGQVAQGFIC